MQIPFNHDFFNHLYLKYEKALEKTKPGYEISQKLKGDQRVTNLSDKMISSGNGGYKFDVKVLGMWFLWCENELGKKAAEQYLNEYLDSDEIEVINTLWILGIRLDEPIELEDGYTIQSVKSMPESRDKDLFLESNYGMTATDTPKPVAAITKTCLVKKIYREKDGAENKDNDQEFREIGNNLYNISMLLNALNKVSCLPYYSTTYMNPGTPFGPFGGVGGSSPMYDVIGYSFQSFWKISRQDRSTIKALINSFKGFGNSEKARIQRILNRLSQAKRRTQIEDKILDLGIAMEMLLLQDNINNDQLSLSFRLRGSWLIGDSPEDRVVIYRKLRDIYNYRSQVAHSGVLCKGDHTKIMDVRDAFPEYQSYAENICRKIIQYGKPDWDKVIFGAI